MQLSHDALLLVDHDLAEHSAEQPRPPVLDAPRLNVDVATCHRLGAGDVETRLEQGVVETREAATDVVRLVDLLATTLTVHVDLQPVQIVHVVLQSSPRVCNKASPSGVYNLPKII